MWEFFVGWRYLIAKRRERFISLISIISILGIAVGVMALIVVIAVMNGFDQELRNKIVSINPHILIEKQGGIENAEELSTLIKKRKEVRGASGFINGQALLKTGDEVTGVLLRGIDPVTETQVSGLAGYIETGTMELADGEIIVGSELAKRFYVNIGDEISIITSQRKRGIPLEVVGIFSSGMYEYDINLVLTNIPTAQDIFGLVGVIGGIGVRLDNLYDAKVVRKSLQDELGYSYWVKDWMSLNRNLFSALKLEKITMFIIVTLIVVVACFNIAGTLIMMVMEKTKDIGILKTIGATNRAIQKIFTIEGITIGIIGTALGAGLGFLLCYLLDTYEFITLPRDIYYLERLPVKMSPGDSLVIVGCALLISLLATVYPARKAASLKPAESLRYE